MVRTWPPRPPTSDPDPLPDPRPGDARPDPARREPAPLDQLPAWRDLVPVMDPEPSRPSRPTGLEALLGGLDPDQLRAVTHGDGPLLVVAGAGTGKTQVITRRIAWLIATRRARPSEILALTFTDKAAEEMAVRVDQLVPYGYTDTAISTFHAFGDGLIREYALELGLPTDVRVLTRPEVVIFLREHLFEFDLDAYRPLGDPTRFLAALATLFSRCKDEDISPADYARACGRAARRPRRPRRPRPRSGRTRRDGRDRDAAAAAPRRPPAGRAGRRVRDATRSCWPANGCIDFGDQVALALRLVRDVGRRPGRDRRAGSDTSWSTSSRTRTGPRPSSSRSWPSGHRNVTVVGDDDQAIYAFRGAAIDNILGFQDRYRGARTVVLRRNYRSLAPILDAAYRLIRFNDPDRLEVRAGDRQAPARRAARRRRRAPVRLEAFATGVGGGRLGRRRDRPADRGRRRAARPRHPRPGERPRRPDPPSPQHGRRPVAVLGDLRPVRAPEVRLLLAFLRVVVLAIFSRKHF